MLNSPSKSCQQPRLTMMQKTIFTEFLSKLFYRAERVVHDCVDWLLLSTGEQARDVVPSYDSYDPDCETTVGVTMLRLRLRQLSQERGNCPNYPLQLATAGFQELLPI